MPQARAKESMTTGQPRRFAARWIGIGVAIGAGLGVVFDDIAVGTGMGVALGVALGGVLRRLRVSLQMSFRSTLTSALALLRIDRGTAVLLGATTALGLAAALPVAGLMGAPGNGVETRLEISTVPGGLLGLPWSDPRSPAGTQHHATTVLFGLLVGMAAATLATGGITLVALVGARDGLAVRTTRCAARSGPRARSYAGQRCSRRR